MWINEEAPDEEAHENMEKKEQMEGEKKNCEMKIDLAHQQPTWYPPKTDQLPR